MGRRTELLPIEVALAERQASRSLEGVDAASRTAPARCRDVPATARRAEPWAGALFVSALACSALLGYVVGEGAGRDAEGSVDGSIRSSVASGVIGLVSGGGFPRPEGADMSDVPVQFASVPRRGAWPELGAARAAGPTDGSPVAGEVLLARDVALAPVDPLWSELGRVRAEILRLRVLFRRLADVAELDDGEFDLDLEPLELPAVRRAADALDLSIRALDPISEQGTRMARIFDTRRAAHDRRIGGRVAPGTVRTSGFGHRPGPFGGRRELHRGVDFAGRPGTPIHALADGVVAFSGANGGYGNLVEIEHGDGYRTRYAHNQSNLVAVGDRIAKGDVVATLGSSGRSTGPHVHVEVRHDGAALDPAVYLR